MNLPKAQRCAAALVAWLIPFCERIQIAGSIRRGRPVVNDIAIVCIPKLNESKDLLGTVVAQENCVFNLLKSYVKERNPQELRDSKLPHFLSGGETPSKQVLLWLPKMQLQLDIFFATPLTFATRLLCRTGSKEHNIWLAQRAKALGLHWNPYEGLSRPIAFSDRSLPILSATETEIYRELNLDYIEPEHRDLLNIDGSSFRV